MKCKICGVGKNSLPAMAKHYRDKHPGHAKAKRQRIKQRSLDVDRPLKRQGVFVQIGVDESGYAVYAQRAR